MVAVALEFGDGQTIMVMRDVITPVVPERFHRHTLGHVSRDVPQSQAASIALAQVCHAPRALDRVNACAIGYHDYASFASRRTRQTLLDQATERLSVSFGSADADDVTRSPVSRSALVTFRWSYAGCADATLLAAKHPHACQGRKQTQFGFILNVDIGAARRVIQKPCNRAFF